MTLLFTPNWEEKREMHAFPQTLVEKKTIQNFSFT